MFWLQSQPKCYLHRWSGPCCSFVESLRDSETCRHYEGTPVLYHWLSNPRGSGAGLQLWQGWGKDSKNTGVFLLFELAACVWNITFHSHIEIQVLKAWDIREQVCLQTIPVRFPFGHRIPEHGPFPFLLITSPINSLFIGSNDCLAEIKIVAMSANKNSKTTHWRPLTAALYNPSMGHVITACEGSVVTFWDLNTGRQAQHISEAHGTEEISCMTIDPSGRRLMTGDRSGHIHVSYALWSLRLNWRLQREILSR